MQSCDIHSKLISDKRCFPTCQKPWSSFANRPHIARELQILCSKSHQTCLCQTDLEVVLVIFLLKQFAMSYLSCCWWWPCWTLCRCHWPRPFATRQAWLSQICLHQLCVNQSLGILLWVGFLTFQSSLWAGFLRACLEEAGLACEAWTLTSWPDMD